MNEAVIVMAKRTAIGKVGGMFKDVPPEELAAAVIKNIIEECQLNPEEIDEVILGNVVGPGGNMARLSLLQAGMPVSVPGVTVDRQCGSGLEAIILAARLIQAGAGDIYLAGGVESTSLAPWKIEKPTSLYSNQAPKIFTRARFSPEEIGDPDMGIAAENVAEYYNISRKDQDLFALASHEKAVRSIKTGRFLKEIVPVRGISTDECPRDNTSFEKLKALKPVFKENGTVTAGNACPINDGAAICLIMSEEKCRRFGLKPKLRFIDAASAGVDPNLLGIGPVPAVQKLLKKRNLSIEDIDIVEFNEAFAAQVLASLRELSIPLEKVNFGGGALALGHPYGASGAVLVTRLCTEMEIYRGSVKIGLATLGIGGGLGLAALFESVND
ncbi:thiolase family protein [Calidifontibacillus erzurumensis]|uniref:Thiolase family protein n=1 Tax=Calidifontibacillus erzurumensis TaxID=2741433 RepID=A0A8J8KCA8_9BACI|nr:thiolase family protein [Calidifontibacillus erzurumensis]NSL52432.1 thiolase family protein [Calidifontibacillus erzurumensis]